MAHAIQGDSFILEVLNQGTFKISIEIVLKKNV